MDSIDFCDSGLDTKSLIKEVRNAIRAVAVGGQSYKIGSRSLTRANLTELRHLLRDLEGEVAAADGRGGLLGGVFLAEFEPR